MGYPVSILRKTTTSKVFLKNPNDLEMDEVMLVLLEIEKELSLKLSTKYPPITADLLEWKSAFFLNSTSE